MASLSLLTLKRGLLLFWAIWFSIVSLTNRLDALQALRVLPADSAFASGNWDVILSTAVIYATPRWLLVLLLLLPDAPANDHQPRAVRSVQDDHSLGDRLWTLPSGPSAERYS